MLILSAFIEIQLVDYLIKYKSAAVGEDVLIL